MEKWKNYLSLKNISPKKFTIWVDFTELPILCTVCDEEKIFVISTHHSVEKREILSHLKNISSNQLFSNKFSKTVTFTKFLPKMREREVPYYHAKFFRQINLQQVKIDFTKFFATNCGSKISMFFTVLPTLSWKYLSWNWFGLHHQLNFTTNIWWILIKNLLEPNFTENWKIEKITWHGRAERGTLNNHFDGKMFLSTRIYFSCLYKLLLFGLLTVTHCLFTLFSNLTLTLFLQFFGLFTLLHVISWNFM